MTTRSICFLLAVGVLTLIVWSCVDVPTGGQAPPNYHALARFVNATADGAGGSVTVDGTPVATLGFGAGSVYVDVLAGGRNIGFGSSVQGVSFRSQSQNTVVIYGLAGSNHFLNGDEGYSFKNNGKGDPAIAQVRFMNVARGSAPEISFFDSSATGPSIRSGVAYGSSSAYTDVGAGTHTVYAVSNGGYMAIIDRTQETPPPTGTRTNGTATVTLTVASGLSYSITLNSDVSDSLYTAAHFHVGPPGVPGPVVDPIDVTAQIIGFPTLDLAGANDVPSDTAIHASGVGTFSFSRDGLAYSVTLTTDASDTQFPTGAFYNAAAGAAGPPVRTISAGAVGDTVLTGTWKSTDVQALTSALITELLAGRIYVRFTTAPGHPAGGIRAQLVPDSLTTNIFTGTWASIPDSLKDSLVAGHMYLNFHTVRSPGGRVRGQLVVDTTQGQYGVGSLPATAFDGARMYTVIASGSGSSLQLMMFSDRQAAASKTAGTSEPEALIPISAGKK